MWLLVGSGVDNHQKQRAQMHSAAGAPPPASLEQINHLLTNLLLHSLSVKCFTGRWQVIRSKLSSLSSAVSEINDSPHWSENSLLQALIPNLLSTLHRIQTLAEQCSDPSFRAGKLLMQSDLDMASGWLSKQIHDLDVLVRSGVLRQSNAIVLSYPGPGSDKEDLGFFIRDLFTRLQIGGLEFKKKAMESLLQLLTEDEKTASIVAKDGNISYLVHLLDLNTNPLIREQAVTAVSILACAGDLSRRCVFEEGGLGPLLRIMESGSAALKEKATMAVASITADADNAWAISAYGGVSVLIDACRSGSPATQAHAAKAIKNVAVVEDIRNALCEEGAVPVLVHLLVGGNDEAKERAADCIAILASAGDFFKDLIRRENGLIRLLHLFHVSSSPEHSLQAIHSLSSSDPLCCRILSSSTAFVIQLAELIKHGNLLQQQICATLLSNLSISDGHKRAIAGCIGALVKLMESLKPDGLQEVAANALLSLLTVKSNRKELVKDEKSLMRLVQMLDPKYDLVAKKFPVAVTSALLAGGSEGCRKRLAAAGAQPHLHRLAEMEVAGAKKALQRLSGNRLKSLFSRNWRELPGK